MSDPLAALDRHVADSLTGLAVAPLSRATRIADIGAGAGFPGLVLAIARPAARVDLIESAARKTAVIRRLAAAAGLRNASVITARAEELAAGEGAVSYGAVTARAVGALAVLVEYAAPLLALDGVLVAWKGARNPDEEEAAEMAATLVGLELVEVLDVQPFEGAKNRHLHVYAKTSPTPERFPRRPGMASKRPLA